MLLALYPWVEVKSDSTPFADDLPRFEQQRGGFGAQLRLIGALSVYNSGVYSNSRMLFWPLRTGQRAEVPHPRQPSRRPINSLFLSGAITSLVVLINYLLPKRGVWPADGAGCRHAVAELIKICLAHSLSARRCDARARTQFKGVYPAGTLPLYRLPRPDSCADVLDEMRPVSDAAAGVVVFLFIAFCFHQSIGVSFLPPVGRGPG